MKATGAAILAILTAGALMALKKVKSISDAGELLFTQISKVYGIKLNPKGRLQFSVDLEFENKSEKSFEIQEPTVTAYYQGKIVGASTNVRDRFVVIPAGGRTSLTEIQFEIHDADTVASNILKPMAFARELEFKISTNVNGLPYITTKRMV